MSDFSFNLTQEQFDKLSIIDTLITNLFDDIRDSYCDFDHPDLAVLGLTRLSLIVNSLLCSIESERSECFDSLLGFITHILNESENYEQKYMISYSVSSKENLLKILKEVLDRV